MKKAIAFLTLSFFLLLSTLTWAQQIQPMSATQIFRKLQQLENLGTVMYFAAHPDDENTYLISYLVHHDHVRTIYYALTRGDGGQNILGDEQGAALGLIRTHELLQARKLDGAEQMFSPFVDFGYTTSVPETFSFWNKKELIMDAVKAYQQVRPDMIICRFPTNKKAGHAHHEVSAIVAKQAWLYIKNYNDTAKHKLWLPKRVLFNSYKFGKVSTIKPGQFKIKIDQYDPLLGEGLGVLAGESRSKHKSQGAGTRQLVGLKPEHFQVIEGPKLKHSLYDGINTTWGRIGHEDIGKDIQQIIRNYKFTAPSASIPALLKVRQQISRITNTFWRQQKLTEINRIILSCAGIRTEALTQHPVAVPGATIPVDVHIIARSAVVPVHIEAVHSVRTVLKGVAQPILLKQDSLYKFPYVLKLRKDEPITEPYWMINPPVHDKYQFNSKYLGMPEAPNKLVMSVIVRIGEADFKIKVPISYKNLDPIRGTVIQRLRIVPAVSIAPTSRLFVFQRGKDKKVVLHVKTFKDIDTSFLTVYANQGLLLKTVLPAMKAGTDTYMVVDIPVEKLRQDTGINYLVFYIVNDGHHYNGDVRLINYPHIPELQYITHAWMKIIPKDWNVAVRKIGYVDGVGDYVDDILRLCGLEVKTIPPLEVNNVDYLKQFDAIVVGIRAFNTKKRLKSGINALLKYVYDGGTLIVQYNKNRHLVTTHLGPYPIKIEYLRTTDETAPVKFLRPKSPLLHFPNKITQKDFQGWVQERGLYYPGQWDKRYHTLFSMHDKGQPKLKGSVLYTDYGRGHYIYTGLSFFRQLPAGNIGAIRLFMNFLSMGKKKR